MFAQDCIDASLPFLRPEDSVFNALDLMQEYKATTLAVIENEKFLGTISENFLLEVDEQQAIGNLHTHFQTNKITPELHLFDVLKATSEFATYFLPVVSLENDYLGITSPQKIIQRLSDNASLITVGGVIVLEMEARNYSLAEIAKIVESNNAMILHSMVSSIDAQQKVFVSLKINKVDLKDVQLSFERYQYNVVAVFHQSEYEMQLKERYDSLIRYLEV
ncbi:MAG: CBS domain-containing protein [Chitinophagales bacterium]|nr:CBS domain-containing protein [Bacteroidota bacterium]